MQKIRSKGVHIKDIDKKPIADSSVLFAVHNSLPYDKSGYAIRTHSIVSHLHENNLSIVVATRAGYPWDLHKHKQSPQNHKTDMISGIQYVRLEDTKKTFKQGSDYKYIITYAKELIRIAKQSNSTIIHGHSNYLNGLASIKAANTLGLPSIYEIRGLWHITRLTLDHHYKEGGMFEYEQQMEKAAALHADAVVTISQSLKTLITSWGVDETKIHVIPNAVNTTLFQPTRKDEKLLEKYNLKDKTIIGFIGSLTGYEGLEQLVLAVNSLLKENINIALIIVGDGRNKTHLESLTSSPNVIFTGRVPFEEVKAYYTLFDICPFPRNDFEVCHYVPPLKILEAMAMQKAIIVSDVPPLLEIIEDHTNGLICKANDVDSLKASILTLLYDDNLKAKLAQNAYSWVNKNRTWDLMIHKYIALYNSFKAK